MTNRGIAAAIAGSVGLVCMLASGAGDSRAQTAEKFYSGRSVSIIVPFTPGGYFDIGARLISRHLGRHIVGKPHVIVQNQPGGIALANRFGAGANNDGLVIGIIARTVPQLALIGDPNIKSDPRELTWIGSLTGYANDAFLLFINATHPAKSALDLRKPGITANVGTIGAGSTQLLMAVLAHDVLKLNLKIVRGFPGANDISLAQARNEVDAQLLSLSGLKSGIGDFWAKGKVRALVQFGRRTRIGELPDVPTARELATSDDDRALIAFAEMPFFMALPLAGPARMPKDRAAALAKAFMSLDSDPEFMKDAAKTNYPVDLVDGGSIVKLINEAANTPKHIIARYKELAAK
jgi:tripartite-type tricarboxylate transporter receptor subunit TctC